MSLKVSNLPAELPEKPVGWKRRMLMHMNYGGKGHVAAFEITDAEGNIMPISFHYDTGRRGKNEGVEGFALPDREGPLMTWTQLRAAWPAWFASQQEKRP